MKFRKEILCEIGEFYLPHRLSEVHKQHVEEEEDGGFDGYSGAGEEEDVGFDGYSGAGEDEE